MISLTGLSPAEGSSSNSLSTEIEFTIIDDGNGLDTSTLIVDIAGSRAITGVDFSSKFQNNISEISFSGSNLHILIHANDNFSKGQIVEVKIQIQDLDQKYFNYSYVFKTISEEPVLVTSNPSDNDTLTGPQYLYLEFEDIFDGIKKSSLNITLNDVNYVTNGEINTSLLGNLSSIIDRTDGDGIIVRLDPIEALRDGEYTLRYTVTDGLDNPLIEQMKFKVARNIFVLPDLFPQTEFVGYAQGINKVSNVGDGHTVFATWHQPKSRSYKSVVYTLLYQNLNRLEIFDGLPAYLADIDVLEAPISNLDTGLTYSFAARAMESYQDMLDLTGMELVADGLYKIPDPAILTDQVLADDKIIYVNSTLGYPTKGFLFIGREIIYYSSKQDDAFIVSTNGRAVSNSTAGIYLVDEEIKLFLQCTDDNTVIVMSTPAYSDGYDYDREIDNEGLVVTDYSDNDRTFIEPYDFCGYHRAQPNETLNGQDDCGSYLGGQFNGHAGMYLFDRLIAREEVLLESVGEPVVLLKRIWDGKTCSCADARRVHPKVKSCGNCFGTLYEGGYSQYLNKRRNDKLIMAAFADTVEDLKLSEANGLQQEVEPSAWTIPIPAIRDRDVIVRFDYDGNIEFMYEVLNVSRAKAIFRHFTRQKLSLKRMDKTDILYTFPFKLTKFAIP